MRAHIAPKFAGICVVGLCGIAAANSSSAQTPTAQSTSGDAGVTPAQHLLSDKLTVDAGMFVVATDVTARLNGNATVATGGQSVDFGHAFGTNSDATRVRADVLWRFLPKHHLRFMYFDDDVRHTRSIDQDIAWGDYTFQANARVTAETKTTVYDMAYEYAFARGDNYEVDGSAGIHYTRFSLGLAGNATVTLPNGSIESASYQSKTSTLPAPLPVFGLRGAWAAAPNLYLDASAQVFKFKYQGYDGSWWDLRAAATWMFSRHFGVGAGWNRFTTHLDVDRSHFQGRLSTG
jgi:hypothetical protein